MDSGDTKQTVRVYLKDSTDVFNNCTDVLANDRQLCFTDSKGKRQEFYGVPYQISEE